MQTASTFSGEGRLQTVDEGVAVTLSPGWLASDWNLVDGSYPTITSSASNWSYSWVSSDGITLSNANIAYPTFTAPDVSVGVPVDYTFTVTIDDGAGNKHVVNA
jgi:hypothetical protein